MISFQNYLAKEAAEPSPQQFTALVVLEIDRRDDSFGDELQYKVEFGIPGGEMSTDRWTDNRVADNSHALDIFPATGSEKWEEWIAEASADALGIDVEKTRAAFEEAIFNDGSSERLQEFIDGPLDDDVAYLNEQEEYWGGYTDQAFDWFYQAHNNRSRRYIIMKKDGGDVKCHLRASAPEGPADSERNKQLRARLTRILADPEGSTRLLDIIEKHFQGF